MARPFAAGLALLLLPALLGAQVDSGGPGLRSAFSVTLAPLRIPATHQLARAMLHPDPAGSAARWAAGVRTALDSARWAGQQALVLRAIYEPGAADSSARRSPLGPQFVDLAIDGNLGVELRADRLKNEKCTPYELLDPASGCRGNFSAPRLDNDLVLQAGGLIGRRLHVNVDFDNKRDFHANNDIRVFYQGLEDEVVQRLEFGTVTFTPPPSRFITAAIPAYSFGVNTRFQIGPMTLGALAASQKGSAVTTRTYVVGSTTSQPQDRALRDLDFEQGRFFWVVDPKVVPGYPAIDILKLSGTSVSEEERPVEVRVYRFRPTGGNSGLGGITAFAYRPDTTFRTGNFHWELMVQGQDYVLDPSGLWIAFANRLDAGDYLAVSYRTASGTVVGSFPAGDDPAANDSLLLVVAPRTGADTPWFRYEMRNIYRVAGTDLDRGSLKVDLTLNRSERPAAGAPTYLAQLGLAIPTDPEVLDVENRLYPRSRDPLAGQVLRESYIVFPTLQPFADSTKLTAAERSDSLYKTPNYLLFTQGPPARFQFRLQYNAAGGGERNGIDLNAFQIRPGSEKIYLEGRVLKPDVDYTISYDLGHVTFLHPDYLFGTSAATVTAQFEERGIFAVAPTTIYGLTSSFRVGDAGSLNFIGIYQQENTAFTRPPVGFEPTANLVGGVTGDLHYKPQWATDLMNGVVRGGTRVPSTLDLTGEFAFTAPQANRAGQAYLEEFEEGGGLAVSLRENAWGFGSRPQDASGLGDIPEFSAGFDSADAVQLTWQNLVPNSILQPTQFRTQQIDSLIRVTGGADPVETVLFFTLHPDTAGGFVDRNTGHSRWSLPRRDGRPRWRSVVTSLSAAGTDLSQSEYLEFWVYQTSLATAEAAGTRLVVDLGSVREDALALAPESLTVVGTDSLWTGRRYAGVGRLDTEREPTGAFNAEVDDNGILVDRPDQLVVNGIVAQDVATCRQVIGGTVNLYGWGDLSVRCTNGNGSLDTEDLNGDNVLDANGTDENLLRYVVPLGDPKYFVRTGGTGWKLYRVPLRTEDARIGTPNLRSVQHLRITVVTPADAGAPDITARFAVARMRFLGSPWVRRSDAPVLGLSGALAQPHGEVVVTTVSTDQKELGYEPPPGVVDQAAQRDATRGLQVNERSLRIIGRDLQQGERAEGYLRFIAGPQNLLKYRTLKLWVRGRGPGWSDDRLQAVFKVGSDDRNFYAYRVGAATDTWLPEVTIDLDTWRALRAQVEEAWLTGQPPSGAAACGAGDSTAYVACQGAYLVQVKDPGVSPPNLAAVQEIDAALHYAGSGAPITETELWVDDIRLVDPVNAVGTATALSARLTAADVADLSVGLVRQDGHFQQVGQDPTFRTTTTAQLSGAVRLERFLPPALGLSLPATVSYTRSTVDQVLVTGTDLRAADLAGLRRPVASQVALGLSVRRSRRGNTWWMRGFVDPVAFAGNLTTGENRTELSQASNGSYSLNGSYALTLPRSGPKLPWGGVIDRFPRGMRSGVLGAGLRNARLTLAPTSIRFGSGLARDEYRATTYQVVVARATDSLLRPTLNLNHTWRNSAGVTLQPVGMFTVDANLSSTRDLRHYSDSTLLGRVVAGSREEFLGIDAGVERDRQLTVSASVLPVVASWVRPRYIRTSSFNLTRSLTSRDPIREAGDSGAFLLPQTYTNTRSGEWGASVDLRRLTQLAFGDSTPASHLFARARPLDLSFRHTLASNFDLATFDPDLGYMLATGSRDQFLVHGDERAIYASQGDEARVGIGADLPGGFSVTTSFAGVVNQRFSLVGGGYNRSRTEQTEWPQGTARWSRPLNHGPLALITLSANARRRVGATVTPSASGASRARTTSATANPEALINFRNGLSADISYLRQSTITANTANRTEAVTEQWSGLLSHSLRLPASLSPRRKAVRVSMNGQEATSQTCLFQSSTPALGCRAVTDLRRWTLSGGLTTEVLPQAEGGLNFQYVVNDVRNANQKTTQLSIVASFRVQLSSGDLR